MSNSFSFITLVFLILGCKTPSFIFDENTLNINLTERSVKKNITATYNQINSLTKKGNAVFLFGNKTQGLNFNLKYKKKQGIQIDGSIILPIFKLLISPVDIGFYEKLNKQYTSISYEQIKKLFGININYKNLESILLGKPYDKKYFNSSKLFFEENKYVLVNENSELRINFYYDSSFRLIEQSVGWKSSVIRVVYDSYELIDKELIPNFIEISIENKKQKYNLTLKSNNTGINETFDMNFNVPSDYNKIEIL